MSNVEVAFGILQSCWDQGVRDVVLCAGARNAPFVKLLSEQNSFRVHPFFEERSAGFFALGRILSQKRPVAVITTSGTAAAELLPAAIEADYQGLPLILISADRPRRYRGSGAPQTINQMGLYSHYVERSWDVEERWNEKLHWSRRRPVHINVCFDEPLLDGQASLNFTDSDFAPEPANPSRELVALKMQRPLILVGGLPAEKQEAVCEVLCRWKRPALIEAHSGLRGHPALKEIELLGGEASMRKLTHDGVIRIGSVPTVRLWRDLENSSLPVVHFSHQPFSGLPREPQVFPLESLNGAKTGFIAWSEMERSADLAGQHHQEACLREFPLAEPAWMQWLSSNIPADARVFLGNSLPIREWDFAASRERRFEIFANRGANGIDGLISTFMGLADTTKSNWCVIGDLSALYDLTGPWANRQLHLKDLNLVVINNGGGKIFHRLFHNPLFENPHDLNFKSVAELWGWKYLRIDRPENLPQNDGPRLIEIVPSNEQTDGFWRALESKP